MLHKLCLKSDMNIKISLTNPCMTYNISQQIFIEAIHTDVNRPEKQIEFK